MKGEQSVVKVASLILFVDFSRLGKQVHQAERGRCRSHTRRCDGGTLNSKGPAIIQSLRRVTSLPIERSWSIPS
jgi:hypothetical protein